MTSRAAALLMTLAFSLVGIVGDYFLKMASQEERPLRSRWFLVGFALYASTAFGWVFAMSRLKLATIGAVYSVSMIVMLTAVGIVGFRETPTAPEFLGLALAIASLALLMRFA